MLAPTEPAVEVVSALASNHLEEAIPLLESMAGMSDTLPRPLLAATARALRTDSWAEVGEFFCRGDYFAADGTFLFIAPFVVRRSGGDRTMLTAVYGRRIAVPRPPDFARMIAEGTGSNPGDLVFEIVPFHRLAVTGAGGEGGEAFLVPDGWKFPGSEKGLALNDMTEQRRRFSRSGEKCIRTIFGPQSADLLLEGLKNEYAGVQLQHREFQYHEAGHAAGLGLKKKLADDLLRTPWYRGIEEWRSDGIEFQLLLDTPGLSRDDAAATIAAKYCLRFGVDAHRAGGYERDTDVMAAEQTLYHLIENGSIYIDGEKKLSFAHCTRDGLIHSTRTHRNSAIQLTRDELALQYEQGVWGLYGSRTASKACREMLKGLIINPCRGFFTDLQ